ncbi:hypothetical protein FB45DRAFT_781794 [Roridomyces roridus]|uniref:Mitochondrial intermembrane space import and assembly protein 40 n=1 Tax=Roridomyces roridus TaxID=1738132 RepID=A0AAD7CFH2_9AGAR|nr:hypothetical protein FB45DRAFT_781794 [Roridomyces roridus]
MFARLSRTRIPLARYIQSQAAPKPSRASKYALAVGTAATVAFFGTQTIALDSPPPQRESSPGKSPEELPTFTSHLLHSVGRVPVPASPAPPEERLDAPIVSSEPVPADEGQSESEYSGGGGAYNPETGEINWDCSCLGGMAHGPCGPQFREAFSCFIYSEDEPKGINCVEKFQGMQNCFREHPEVYAAEIADDEEAAAAEEAAEKEAAQNVDPAPSSDSPVDSKAPSAEQ